MLASQRAAAVSAVYGWTRVGRPTNKSHPEDGISKTEKELASIAGVSVPTIQRAKKVEQKAIAFSEVYAWGRIGDNQHKNRTGTECPSSENSLRTECGMGSTAAELAHDAGVSTRTVERAGRFADAVVTIEDAAPKMRRTLGNQSLAFRCLRPRGFQKVQSQSYCKAAQKQTPDESGAATAGPVRGASVKTEGHPLLTAVSSTVRRSPSFGNQWESVQ